jgi:hypothetical protein
MYLHILLVETVDSSEQHYSGNWQEFRNAIKQLADLGLIS